VPEYQDFADTYAKHEAEYFASVNGLPEDILNRKVVSNGKSFTIIRVERKNIKYPIIAHCSEDGKNYKLSVQEIKKLLDKTK
jgi:hypothetical protein